MQQAAGPTGGRPRIEQRPDGRVTAAGALDLYCAAALDGALASAAGEGSPRLVLDLRGAESIDFSTIAVIARNGSVLRDRRARLEVVCEPGDIARMLEVVAAGRFELRTAAA